MDGAPEGLPYDPTIRIPPIQDPSTVHVISNSRPSPLEPSAAEGQRPTAVRLTSRSKALANALPIGGNTPIKPLDTRRASATANAPTEDREKLSSRKRQKDDYVQLPQPKKRSSIDRNASLEAIPRLSGLHQPPPSAARFPPITAHEASPLLQRPELPQLQNTASIERSLQDASAAQRPTEGVGVGQDQVTKKPKRVYTRGRRNWTQEETDSLLRGVAKYGVGKWKRIMEDPDFEFPPDRTPVDLKDRYRTCKMHEERRIERHANGEPNPDRHPSTRRPSKVITSDMAKTSLGGGQITPVTPTHSEPTSSGTPKSVISFAAVNTVQDVAKSLDTPSKSESRRWTPEEDANLSRGFQKYGFSWTSISKDPELQLQHRTGTQLRDRFRIKFPILYQQSVPVQLPETPPGKDSLKRRRRRPADPQAPRGGIKVVLATPEDPKGRRMDPAQHAVPEQRSKTLTIADMTDTSPTNMTRPSLPSMSSLVARVDAQPLPEGMQYPSLDIQPLPDSDDYDDEDSDYDDMEERDSIEGQEMGSLSGGDDESAGRSGHDVRHLSISGLLNEEQGEVLRLPPFRTTYDDTNELPDESGRQLPSLSFWDEITPRPMFDLD